MRRRLFKLLPALSLASLALAVALWGLSYTKVQFDSHHGRLYCWRTDWSKDGTDMVVWTDVGERPADGPLNPRVFRREGGPQLNKAATGSTIARKPPQGSLCGMEWWSGELFGDEPGQPVEPDYGLRPVHYWLVAVSYWWIVLLTAPLPLMAAVHARRLKRRVDENRCAGCGYDLRASPGRCPECGSEPVMTVLELGCRCPPEGNIDNLLPPFSPPGRFH